MHFGAERGMNSAEGCEGVLVIGREQPQLAALEDLARGFAIDSEEPFVSVLDEKEEGELRPLPATAADAGRLRGLGRGPLAPRPVRPGAPGADARGGVVQMADRVRAIWHDRLIIIATNLPVDLDVTQLVTQGDLMRAAGQAAEARQALAERGWWLRVGGGRNGRRELGERQTDP